MPGSRPRLFDLARQRRLFGCSSGVSRLSRISSICGDMGYQAGRPRWIAPDQSAPLIRTADAVTDIGHAAGYSDGAAPLALISGWATEDTGRELTRPNIRRMWNVWCSTTRFMADPPITRCWDGVATRRSSKLRALQRRQIWRLEPEHARQPVCRPITAFPWRIKHSGEMKPLNALTLMPRWHQTVPAARRTPPSFRAPTGAMADSFERRLAETVVRNGLNHRSRVGYSLRPGFLEPA